MVCVMRVLGRGVCAASMCAVACLSCRLYGIEVSFDGEATGTTVADLMSRDGARIFAESDGDESLVVDCVSPSGTKCLIVETDMPSKGVCFGVTTNEAGLMGSGFVQQASRVLAFEAQILPTMYEESLQSIPLAAPVKVATTTAPKGWGGVLYWQRPGLVVAVDGDIAVCPSEFYDDMDDPIATNWCVVAGERVGNDVVTRSYTLENANGSSLPPVGNAWHKIVLKRMIVDGAVRYSVSIDGVETRSVGDGATNFLSVASSPADPVRALRFVGTGRINGIVLPDERELCLFGYEDYTNGRAIVSYLGEGPSIVIPSSIDGVAVTAVSSLDCSNPEEIREIVVPTNITKRFGVYEFWNLERIVFADEIPFAGFNATVLQQILMRADAIYYPRAYAAKWYKTLKNLGYGGRYGSYSGPWIGEACVDAKALPVGFVNVITEITSSGGAVAVPETWSANYPRFQELFGNDLTKALTLSSGKLDASGKPMLVWQDYVAGTDPTDEDDTFTASITLVDGVPVISYTPELTAEQKALRVYKTYGKQQLQDTAWTDVSDFDGEAKKSYNFFKVTVEMK